MVNSRKPADSWKQRRVDEHTHLCYIKSHHQKDKNKITNVFMSLTYDQSMYNMWVEESWRNFSMCKVKGGVK